MRSTTDGGEPVIAAVDVVTGERRWELPAENFVPFTNDATVSALTERLEFSGRARRAGNASGPSTAQRVKQFGSRFAACRVIRSTRLRLPDRH